MTQERPPINHESIRRESEQANARRNAAMYTGFLMHAEAKGEPLPDDVKATYEAHLDKALATLGDTDGKIRQELRDNFGRDQQTLIDRQALSFGESYANEQWPGARKGAGMGM